MLGIMYKNLTFLFISFFLFSTFNTHSQYYKRKKYKYKSRYKRRNNFNQQSDYNFGLNLNLGFTEGNFLSYHENYIGPNYRFSAHYNKNIFDNSIIKIGVQGDLGFNSRTLNLAYLLSRSSNEIFTQNLNVKSIDFSPGITLDINVYNRLRLYSNIGPLVLIPINGKVLLNSNSEINLLSSPNPINSINLGFYGESGFKFGHFVLSGRVELINIINKSQSINFMNTYSSLLKSGSGENIKLNTVTIGLGYEF